MDAALNSVPLIALILLVDFAITFSHSYQEWRGLGAPIWRNFGAIVGVDIPDRWGFPIFTVLLTVSLFAIGFVGIIGPLRWSAFALGALIGARLSDTLISHVLLYGVGYRPNPGLSSTPLYVLEALFIVWAFQPRLAANPSSAKAGLVLGILAFVLVLPGLWLVRQANACLEAITLAALATDAVVGLKAGRSVLLKTRRQAVAGLKVMATPLMQ
jgi:hypothetical protein